MATLKESISKSSEVFLSKTDPQIWIRREGGGWTVVHFDERYEPLVSTSPAELPVYAIIGEVMVSADGKVETELKKNQRFDPLKIETCKLHVKK